MADDSGDVIILYDGISRSSKTNSANGESANEQRPNGGCKNGDGCDNGSIQKHKPGAGKSTPASPKSKTTDNDPISCAQNGAGSLLPGQETEENLFDIFSIGLPNGDALANDQSASSREDGGPSSAKRRRLAADDTEDHVDVDGDGGKALGQFRNDLKIRASIAMMGTCDCEEKRREMDAQILQWRRKMAVILNSYKALENEVNVLCKSGKSRRTVAVQVNIPDVTAETSSIGVGASSAISTVPKLILRRSTPDLQRTSLPISPAVNSPPVQLPAGKIRKSTFIPPVNYLQLPLYGTVDASLASSSSASTSRRVKSVQTVPPAKTPNCLDSSQKQQELVPAQTTSSPLVKENTYVVKGPQQQNGIRILPDYGAVSPSPKLVRAATTGSVAGTSLAVQNRRLHTGPNVQAHSKTVSENRENASS